MSHVSLVDADCSLRRFMSRDIEESVHVRGKWQEIKMKFFHVHTK